MCACVAQLASTLKPEYANALRRIEVDKVPFKEYTGAVGIRRATGEVAGYGRSGRRSKRRHSANAHLPPSGGKLLTSDVAVFRSAVQVPRKDQDQQNDHQDARR
ncbi:MAG: hypothetical protein ABJA82_14215 [Myxococcales bacterium]